MLLLRQSLYGAVSDEHVFGLFIAFAPAVMIGFTHEANIALEAGLAKFVSQCSVDRVSLTGTMHFDFFSTFYKADVTSSALSSHFVSCF